MIPLLRKEVSSFFNSLIAYVVLAVFLVGNGLFFWVFSGNILQSGLATLDALFTYAPWFLLLLVPALTMRAFAEEFHSGTFELLATKPLTDWQLVLGKYLAAVVLVIFALLPTLVYYFTVSYLGNPPGNLDTGATWGAYIGLLAIGAAFSAIGIFTSTLTTNQIVAFIGAAFVCFFIYQGFDLLADLPAFAGISDSIAGLGLTAHYQSISRGVVDSRDVLYFLSLIALFSVGSYTALRLRKA